MPCVGGVAFSSVLQNGSTTRVLVTGATGYVGGRLAPLLVEEGFVVRVLVRSAAKVANTPWITGVEVVEGDAINSESLDTALANVDVAFYLLHSISTGAKFDDLESAMALTFAQAAARAGVKRIIYLGGIANDDNLSKHLESRKSVGRVLASTNVPVIELRAGIIIGSGSASFEMLRYLTEHLPAMVTPRWVDNPTQPIAIVNMLHFLVAAARAPQEIHGVFDVGGSETITYRNMMSRYAKIAGLRRRIIVRVPLLTPRVSSMWVGLVTPVPASIARPLIDSLINKVVVDSAKSVVNVLPPPPGGLLTFDQAVKRAIERTSAPTRWTDASRPWVAWDVAVTDPAWTGEHCSWTNESNQHLRQKTKCGVCFRRWVVRLAGTALSGSGDCVGESTRSLAESGCVVADVISMYCAWEIHWTSGESQMSRMAKRCYCEQRCVFQVKHGWSFAYAKRPQARTWCSGRYSVHEAWLGVCIGGC